MSLRNVGYLFSYTFCYLQVEGGGLYLTDDRNTAVFPDNHGLFATYDLVTGGHYEVHGGGSLPPAEPQATPPQFQFAQRPVASAASTPSFRRPTGASVKTFQR